MTATRTEDRLAFHANLSNVRTDVNARATRDARHVRRERTGDSPGKTQCGGIVGRAACFADRNSECLRQPNVDVVADESEYGRKEQRAATVCSCAN